MYHCQYKHLLVNNRGINKFSTNLKIWFVEEPPGVVVRTGDIVMVGVVQGHGVVLVVCCY